MENTLSSGQLLQEKGNRKTLSEVKPVPAATVVLVRNKAGESGIEVLLLERNANLVFHGGHWVFPGGRLDAADFAAAENGLEFHAAKQAAVRETREEAGIEIRTDQLIHTAHWTTPPRLPRRFSTWFFVCPLHRPVQVRVDNKEILDFRWLTPARALKEHNSEQLVLPAPTRTTLQDLTPYHDIDTLTAALSVGKIRVFPADSSWYRPREMGYRAG